jgi:hypothetical protein
MNQTVNDGFDSAAGDRLIQGEILKFADGNWSTKAGTPIASDLALLVVGTTRALQHWEARMPITTIIERAGEPLPDIEELNAAIPEQLWELGLDGKPRPPWILQSVVYLLDVADASSYTYLNSTAGARIAVERLAERVNRMRMLRSARVLPLVNLDAKPMKTKFGTKARPEFAIIDWKDFSAAAQALPAPNTPAIGGPVAPVSVSEELNDEINF